MLITSTRRNRSVVLAGAVVVALLAACSTEGTRGPSTGAAAGTPAARASASLPPVFYVDPESPASEQVRRWQAEGRPGDAAMLRGMSEQPTARWMTSERAPVRDEVDALVGRAKQAGQVPVLVVHNLPQRDCGRAGTGGAPTAAEYQRWVRDLAAGIEGRPVTVILEPNGVADAVAGCVRNVNDRYGLLRDAIAVLASTGSARIYLDAGHPGWIADVRRLADGLTRAGIAGAHGFALNVGSFVRTADNVRYGHLVSDALGGRTPFVVDTSRNGNGPYPDATVNGAPSWCNPPGRALGEKPTDRPGLPRVDALLWIKYPGESDGPCRAGEPELGFWWPEYALDLVKGSA